MFRKVFLDWGLGLGASEFSRMQPPLEVSGDDEKPQCHQVLRRAHFCK